MRPPDGLLYVRGEVISQHYPEERQGLQNQYYVGRRLMSVSPCQYLAQKSQLIINFLFHDDDDFSVFL